MCWSAGFLRICHTIFKGGPVLMVMKWGSFLHNGHEMGEYLQSIGPGKGPYFAANGPE